MSHQSGKKTSRPQTKSSYRLYMERCQRAGREPLDFDDYLVVARRWRLEYDGATERGDVSLMRELEELLCEPRGDPKGELRHSHHSKANASNKKRKKKRRRSRR